MSTISDLIDLIKMNDVDFQPLELILRERVEPIVWKYKKNNNHIAIQDTVKHLTEDHFSKLYEYIYLHSKPLSNELSKITREHFSSATKKQHKGPNSAEKQYTIPRPPRLRVLAPSRDRSRLNKSCIEPSAQDYSSAQPKMGNISFVRNASIDMMSQDALSDKRGGSGELSSMPLIGPGGRSSTDIEGKLRLPKIVTANEDSLQNITEKPSNASKNRSEFQMIVPKESRLPSRDPTPNDRNGRRRNGRVFKREPSIVTNVLATPAFKEKYKERANRIRAEGIISLTNPDFMKLVRLIANDDKTQMIQLVKITKEQLRNHLLKRYPVDIVDRFLQVMDFPSIFDVKTYMDAFKSLLTDGLDISYFLCFKLFDLNDDGILNHRDIFTLLKNVDDYPLLQTDFNKLLYKPHKKGPNKLVQAATKNMLRNTAQMSIDSTPHEKQSYLINKNTLTLKVNLLKNLESMISQQGDQRIMNLTQLRMVHQTELNVFLNYRRGKYKHTCWADMIGALAATGGKKTLAADPANSRVSISMQTPSHVLHTPSHITEKASDHMSPIKLPDISSTNLESISDWGEAGLDVARFAEVFKDDMPYLIYDIFFHCTVADASNKRYQFYVEDVFNLYNLKLSNVNITNTSGTNIVLHSKNSRTSGISALLEAKGSLDTRYSDDKW